MKHRWSLVAILVLALPTLSLARWIQDKVVMPVTATGPVEFSHYNHLEALGKNCPTCHNAIFDVVREKNPRVTMAEMAKDKSCGACHNGTKAFAVSDSKNCSTCHPTRDITFDNDGGKVVFSHEVHTGLFGCGECHPGTYQPVQGKNSRTSMQQMEGGKSCGVCHDGSTAFTVKENCESCHQM